MSATAGVHVEPATIGRRVLAVVVDAAIACAGLLIVGIVTSVIVVAALRPTDPAGTVAAALIAQLVVWVVAVAWGIVVTAMQGGAGSIGQRAAGVRVADRDTGAPLGFWRALLRNIVWGAAGAIVVGYFSPLFDGSRYRQGWHDMATHAIVVGPDPAEAAPAAPGVPALSYPAPERPPAPTLGYATAPVGGGPEMGGHAATAAGAAPAVPPPYRPSGAPAAPAPGAPVVAPLAPVAPAMPIARTGVISEVPGIGARREPAADAASPAGASPSAAAPAPTGPFSPEPSGDTSLAGPPSAADGQTLGATMIRGAAAPASSVAAAPTSETSAPAPAVAPAPSAAAAPTPEAPAPAEPTPEPVARTAALLVWDNGTRTGVHGRTLFGRNPSREDGATAVAVRDETLSLSKTHFELDADAAGLWVVDQHSTNGVVLVRNGRRAQLTPGQRTPVRSGDRLEFGDRSATVELGE